MESHDESIELLKMRMHHQMNVSSENDIKPENIQYYVASLMMQKEDMHKKERVIQKENTQQPVYADREIYQIVYEKLQNGEKLSEKENDVLRKRDLESYQKAKNIERESEEYAKLPTDEEYVRRSGEIPPVIEGIKVPDTMEVQHERAKNEYEKVLQAVDDEEIFGFRKPHWINIKG